MNSRGNYDFDARDWRLLRRESRISNTPGVKYNREHIITSYAIPIVIGLIFGAMFCYGLDKTIGML